jgi:hypothetical protein
MTNKFPIGSLVKYMFGKDSNRPYQVLANKENPTFKMYSTTYYMHERYDYVIVIHQGALKEGEKIRFLPVFDFWLENFA